MTETMQTEAAQRAYRDALLVVTELPKILGLRGEPT